MFATVTLHPATTDLSSVSPEKREEIIRTAGQMFERLLTIACEKESREAIRYEGALAIQQSFQTLGQVASVSMMTDPSVQAGFALLSKHIDQKKIDALGASK